MAFKYSNDKHISDTPCSHCNKQSTYKSVIHTTDTIKEATLVYNDGKFSFPYYVNFQAYQCEYCDRYRFIITKVKIYSGGISREETILEFPLPGFQDLDRGKIQHALILDNLDEGMRCLVANSTKGAIVNFRRALQTAVLILGAEGENLEKQIDNLHKKEIIRSKTKDLAHKVRALGNLGAHPYEIKIDKSGNITSDDFSELTLNDAQQAAQMLVLFLEDAFIYPSKLDIVDKRLDELKNKK